MPILPSQASPTIPSLLLPALVITSTCLFPAAHATLPLDDPALAEDLKAYIVSLDPTKPEDCIGFVNRHLSDILYTRFTHKSVLEDELARMKSTHATACLRNKTLKGISKEEILRLEAAERASPWWERSGWATRDKQSLLRLPPDAIKDAVPDADPALAANPSRSNPPPNPKRTRRPPGPLRQKRQSRLLPHPAIRFRMQAGATCPHLAPERLRVAVAQPVRASTVQNLQPCGRCPSA